MNFNLNASQKRVLQIALMLALLFGAYFLRGYFDIIIIAAVMAFLFNTPYKWLKRKTKRPGLAAATTLFITMLAVIIPLTFIFIITTIQVSDLLDSIPKDVTADVGRIGTEFLNWLNNLLARLPGDLTVTYDDIWGAVSSLVEAAGQALLRALTSSLSSIPALITQFILYLYVFVNILLYQDTIIHNIKKLNPLGDTVSNLYLQRVSAMTTAMVRGQFIIATLQGFVGALSLYVVGFHNIFFLAFLVLSVLCLIPLGSGIILIPTGIILMLFGDVWQGAVILLTHFLITTNIDNILRPMLVPKTARLNSALTMLSVFAGLSMFGFLGIILGPVIMVVITSTVQIYFETKSDKAITS